MKKLLSLLGSVSMIGTAGATVVACGNEKASEAVPEVSKQALVLSINEASKLLVNSKNSNPVAEGNLRISIADAQRVVDDVEATQEVVDSAKETLDAAIVVFKNETQTNYAKLTEVINKAIQLRDNPKNPNEEALKTFSVAITDAQNIVNAGTSSQAEVDAAVTKLEKAIQTFSEETATNYDKLTAKIKEAQTAIEESNNPNANKEALTSAIEDAKKIESDKEATQVQVDEATTKLATALDKFKEETSIQTDYSILEKTIETAKQAIINCKNHKEEAESNLQTVIDLAVSMYEAKNSSQETVNSQVKLLESAIKKFQESTKTVYNKLQEMISTAEKSLADNKNPNANTEKLTEAINVAKAVNDNKNASQVEVDNATATLEAAIEAFENTPQTNFVKLRVTIANAKVALGRNINPNEKAETALKTEIETAQKISDNKKASQVQVDDATNSLKAAIEKFETLTATDYTQLRVTIANAKVALGRNENPNADVKRFTVAIEAAENVVNNKNASQVEVDNATATLEAAIEAFENTPQTNFVKLRVTIANAKVALGRNINPNEKAETALKTEIETAQKISDNKKASQVQVDDATNSLKAAIEKFETLTATDYTQLRVTIANAKVAIVRSINRDEKLQSTLSAEISTAQKISDNKKASQVQVDDATNSLKAAIEKFETLTATDYTQLRVTIANAKVALGRNENPNADVKRFTVAIEAAENVVNNKNASQVEVDNAIDTLEKETIYFTHTHRTDYRELNATIALAFKTLEENTNPNANKEAFLLVIEAANKVAKDKQSTQNKVDKANADLKEAIKIFKSAEVTKTDKLISAISAAEKALADEAWSTNPNADIERFTAAIEKAKEILAGNPSQVVVDQAVFVLEWETWFFIGTPLTYFGDLVKAIEDANRAIEENNNPNAVKWENKLKGVISDAEKMVNDKKVSQSKVEKMTETLKKATEEYKNTPVTDFSELKEKIKEAEDVLHNKDYKYVSDEAKEKLQENIDAAKEAINENIEQHQVGPIIMLLNLAIKSFKESLRAQPLNNFLF